MTLAELQTGQKAMITKVKGRGVFRRRIMDMGFIHGKVVTVIKSAPLRDPIEYEILGYNVSLRHAEAELIEVVLLENFVVGVKVPAPDFPVRDEVPAFAGMTSAPGSSEFGFLPDNIEVALVGNPNCGKTSIFNLASHSRERTGNYAGVTVEAKIAEIRLNNQNFQLTDLPGTYSLSAFSPDELFVRDQLLIEHPDVVINVIVE